MSKRKYGRNNTPEDMKRCIQEVAAPPHYYMQFYQCSRKRGHGTDGKYCKQHSTMKGRD